MAIKTELDLPSNKPCEAGKGKVRDRIFETACELFYQQGIRCVGIDAIVNAAGTNKMSFYRSFASKDELVAAYLRDRERNHWEWWDATIAPFAGSPQRQILALFEAHVLKSQNGDSCGCGFVNAAVELRNMEHPAQEIIHAAKTEMRRRFRKLAKETGARTPDVLGDALTLLAEGGAMSSVSFSCDESPISNVAKIVKKMLEAYMPKTTD